MATDGKSSSSDDASPMSSSSDEGGSNSNEGDWPRSRSGFNVGLHASMGLKESEHAHLTFDRWAQLTGKAPKVESQGFPLLLSDQARTCKAPVFHTWRIWIVLVAVGLATGVVAAVVDQGLEIMFKLRMDVNSWVVASVGPGVGGLFLQYLAFCAMAMLLAGVSGWLVCFHAPLAAGSGIPEIKCFLNGIVLSRVVSKVTLIAKVVGIIFSVSAGLPVGKEGPMIHSGAVVAGLLSKMTIDLRNAGKREQPLSLNSERRDMIAAGATAGVAAAFGAPMGACLFAIEEGTSHMSPRILLKLFVAAAASALMARFALALAREPGDVGRSMVLGTSVPVFLTRFPNMDYAIWEFPIFMLIGAFGGLLGGLFNNLNKMLTLKRKVWMPAPQFDERGRVNIQRRDVLRFAEVLFVTFVITSLHFWMPMVKIMSSREDVDIGAQNLTGGQNGTKLARTIEELTQTQKLFWDTGTAALRDLLKDSEDFHPWMLCSFCVMHFFTTCWTYGLGVPSGLFVPSLLMGAAFGRLVGQAMQLTGWAVATPGIYALVGATAMLAGAARITISLAMILMEVTGEAGFSLPIFVTVMVARWVGNLFGRGIYDLHIIELKRVPLLEHDPEDVMIKMRVHQVMATDVVSFQEVESCSEIHQKLMDCTHNGFPVVRDGRVVGSIARDILHYLLNNGDSYGVFDIPKRLVPFRPMHGTLARKHPGLAPLSPAIAGKALDLKPYLSKDFHSMLDSSCLFSCYNVFRQLGLRHLFVVSEDTGELCGVISRKNLILIEDEVVQAASPTSLENEGSRILTSSVSGPVDSSEDQDRGFGAMLGL